MSDTPSSPGPAPATFRAGAGSPLPPPVPGTGAGGPAGVAGTPGPGGGHPPAGPAPATPPGARSHPLPPPGNRPPEDAPPDDDGFRPPLWVFILVPVLIVGLAALLIWRNATDSGPGSSPVVSDTTVFAPVPSPTVTTPAGVPGTAGGTTLPSATTTAIPATTAPPSTAPTPTTAAAPTTAPAPSTTSPRPTTPPNRVLVVAQQVATALADGNWAAVRKLSPTDQRTNAQFERDYAGLDRSTVVPARQTRLSSGLVDLRLGLVAHESRTSGPQTSLYCAHWIVDPATSTVQRLDGALVRTMGGTVPPNQVAAELATTCATMALR